MTLSTERDEFDLRAYIHHGIQHPQGSQRSLHISESVCEYSQLNMFVLEMHCFFFSILCSLFFSLQTFQPFSPGTD